MSSRRATSLWSPVTGPNPLDLYPGVAARRDRCPAETLDTIYIDRFIDYAHANPHEFPMADDYLSLLKEGKLKVEIDKDFPKALVTTQLLKHQWLHHQAWDVVWNDTDQLFLTSDNPSCFDYEYGSQLRAARYLPLTPRLALWTLINQESIPQVDQDISPARLRPDGEQRQSLRAT